MIYISSLGGRLSGGPLKISIVTSAPLTVAVHSGSANSVPEEPGAVGTGEGGLQRRLPPVS